MSGISLDAGNQPEKLSGSFSWLNATQFLGALNDNIYKLLVTFFLIRTLGPEHSSIITGLSGIIFALPFILLIPAAGVLADRHSKSGITVMVKVAEIAVMAAAVLAFWLGWPVAGFAVLFLMAAQSAFFNPVKYGIIPELVPVHQLSRANGYLVAFTYLSIIFGTVLGPWITEVIVGREVTDRAPDRFAAAGLVCVLLAVAGTWTALRIQPTPAAGTNRRISWRFWHDIRITLREHKHDRYLIMAIFASAYFSLIGAFIQLNLIPYAIRDLGLGETAGGYLFVYAALGIGAGSLMAGRLSGRNIEFGIIPIGALLIALSGILLMVLPADVRYARVMMTMAGVGAGLFIIPIEAFIQLRAPRDKLGAVMAANGFVGWVGILLAGVFIFVLGLIPSWRPVHTFGLLGALTLVVTIIGLKELPDFFVRFTGMLLTRSIYKIRKIGLENLPLQGGGLLVSNHVSYMDAVLILASQQRRVRFLIDRDIYEQHPLRMLLNMFQVIPVSVNDSPKKMMQALIRAREEMDKGYLVCIFAEGALTRTGQMRALKPGLEKVMKGRSEPIIPVYLGGVWGSRFSYFRSMIRGTPAPRQWRHPVTVSFGKPLLPDTPRWKVELAIRELSAVHFDLKLGPRRSVAYEFVRSARRHFRSRAMHDTSGKTVTYGQALIGALIFRRLVSRRLGGQSQIGVVLPPSVGGSIVNLGLLLAGKVPVNLNFTASAEAFTSSIRQAGITTVITARKMAEKVPHLIWPEHVIYADDLLKSVSFMPKILSLLSAFFIPARWLAPVMKQNGHDLLTIIFSSGTTAEPKGIMLSHHNVLSNVDALRDLFRVDPDLHLCSALPIFHSFGFTGGVFFPLLCGMKVSYHPSPLDAAHIVDLIKTQHCNVLLSTPSFLLSYCRKAEPGDLKSLRFVVVGAEKLKRAVADACEEKLGIRPLEGYGTTELSPVVSLNLPDFPAQDRQLVHQGGKEGTIGQPIPGVVVKVVGVESGEILPPGEEGMIMVKGPNVMLGYLNRPDLTTDAMRDGWYKTGDIGRIDEDGFITVTDRLMRFSKIAGEMVPHMAIEEALFNGLQAQELALAVTAVPDDRKGERLVLLHTERFSPEELRNVMSRSGLPNLWKPSDNMIFKVPEIPITSTGKLDIRQVKQMACELASMLRL